MRDINSEEKVYQYLHDIEVKYKLFDCTIGDIFFWKLVRFTISRRILIKLGLIEVGRKTKSHKSIREILLRHIRNISFFHKKTEIIVLENPRKFFYNKHYIDPYTYHIKNILDKKNADYILIEDDSFGLPSEHSHKRWFFSKRRKKINKSNDYYKDLLDADQNIEKIANEINTYFDISIDLKKIITKQISKFIADKEFFSNIFKRIKPKYFVLVCSYGKEGIIYAAHSNGVIVIEAQHGTITHNHFGYSFPALESIPYYPDKILGFSEIWFESLNLPKVEIVMGGYPVLGTVKPTGRIGRKDIDIIIISQWIYSEKLLEFVVELSLLAPQLNIVYKAHPRDNIPDKLEESSTNLTIAKTESLSYWLNRSIYAIGVFSTGVYEALIYNCYPILLNLPGIDNMQKFIDQTRAPVCNTAKELIPLIKQIDNRQYKYGNLDSNIWFSPISEKKIWSVFSNE